MAQDIKQRGKTASSNLFTFASENCTRDSPYFIGSVIYATYDAVTFATHDAIQKQIEAGLSKGKFVLMIPKAETGIKDTAILLQITEITTLPREQQLQDTRLEIAKTSDVPDVFTCSELGYTGLNGKILGMYVKGDELTFGSDVPSMLSPQQYVIIAPPAEIIDCIINTHTTEERVHLGTFRPTETIQTTLSVPFYIPVSDLLGKRTGVFGVTRSGKSNLNKGLVVELDKFSEKSKTKVGQLIFDADGEYFTDNIHSAAVTTVRNGRVTVYSTNPIDDQIPLKLDFYADPQAGLSWAKEILLAAGRDATYIEAFLNTNLTAIEDIPDLPHNQQLRERRKNLFYYCILYKAGFIPNPGNITINLDPNFTHALRDVIYEAVPQLQPTSITTLDELLIEVERVIVFAKQHRWNHPHLTTASGNPLFDADDKALLTFLTPNAGSSGVAALAPVRIYHDATASDVFANILSHLDAGEIVIIDLSSADESQDFMTEKIISKLYYHQNTKLKQKLLNKTHFVQTYLEEAQTIFPALKQDYRSIYEKIAKQGGKLNLGCVYLTQSPSSCDKRFLDQTENIFVSYLNSIDEITFLSKINSKFELHRNEINNSKSKGYLRGITESGRFIVPFQAIQFQVNNALH
tara:strand:+ start:74 stop:1975 length:1902 start_codon:yes stop_codon:yes gene_type:complete